jgi:uncharacterized protein (TIGR03083 family)
MLRLRQAGKGWGGRDSLRHVADDPAGGGHGWAERGRAGTAALAETWRSLAEACEGLSPDQWRRPTACPGWTVQDQLSHLIGIERVLDGEPEPAWDEPPGPHVKNDFAAHNEKWIAARRDQPGATVLAEFTEVTGRRLGTLRGLDEAAWGHVGPTIVGEVAYADFMKTRVFDSWVHEQDVRLALGRPGGSGGLASDIGLGQVQSAMGFVVGKKAAAPEGSVVRFCVQGPGVDARQFTLAVTGGRAGPADPAARPSVTLTLLSLAFLRLGCGRSTSAEEEAAAGVEVAGDAALGGKILEAMNFMF